MKFCVIGLGYFGRNLALALTELGAEVIAIDREEGPINDVKDHVSFAAIMDASQANTLRNLPIADMDAVIVAIGENFESSLLATAHIQEMGCRRIICRAVNAVHSKLLRLMQIEEIILPEALAAQRMAKTLIMKGAESIFELSEGFSIMEVEVSEDMLGKSLSDLALRDRYRINIVTIKSLQKKSGGESAHSAIGVPKPDYKIRKDDILVVFGADPDLRHFLDR